MFSIIMFKKVFRQNNPAKIFLCRPGKRNTVDEEFGKEQESGRRSRIVERALSQRDMAKDCCPSFGSAAIRSFFPSPVVGEKVLYYATKPDVSAPTAQLE